MSRPTVPEVGVSAVDVLSSSREERTPVILLGVGWHKSTHTATAVDPASNQQAGSRRIEASLAEYRRLLTWGGRWPQRSWVVENANGLGRHLAPWIVACGERSVDVPASATSRVRRLTRDGGCKNDRMGGGLTTLPTKTVNSERRIALPTDACTPSSATANSRTKSARPLARAGRRAASPSPASPAPSSATEGSRRLQAL